MKCLDHVNIKMGSHSLPERSCGNTNPFVGAPFGMNHFALQTRIDDRWFFHPEDVRAHGIRLTHQPSPWIGDYAKVLMTPLTGEEKGHRSNSSYDIKTAVFTPAYMQIYLNWYGVTAELVPTLRGGILRSTWNTDPAFPGDRTRRFVLNFGEQLLAKEEGPCYQVDWEQGIVRCVSAQFRSFCNENIPQNFCLYGVFSFGCPLDREKSICEDHVVNLAFSGMPDQVECRFATSFISMEVAEFSLQREVGETSFEALREQTETQWEELLSKIEIEAEEAVMDTFYSCLYRMFLFPRVFHELCPDGKVRHFSPGNGKICDGVLYTDNGFWDTYKTVYPLYSLILGEKYAEMCEGFLNFYRESGWLPRWMSPAAVNCMPGTAIDAVFADAAVKGVVTDPAMLREMLDSLLQHADNVSEDPAVGRDGLADFQKLGYVSNQYHESVNKTLDYAYGDFCIAKIAEILGDEETAARMNKNAQNYRNLFDAETGFIRAKNSSGEMRDDFTQFDWGGDYTEGGPWQCSFGIYHDFKGYANLLGGRKKLLDKIQQLFDTPPYFRPWGYDREIHEMTEMRLIGDEFGQLALSNQPSFHVPYIFSCVGDRDRTAYWVRKAMAKLFKAQPKGFPGDEDNGSMAGWYVFSALGFYPVCPGVDEYVVGSPAVKSAKIYLDNGKILTVSAPENSAEKVYAQEIKLNGEKVLSTALKHGALKEGGELCFAMSEQPSGQQYNDDQLAYSMSK